MATIVKAGSRRAIRTWKMFQLRLASVVLFCAVLSAQHFPNASNATVWLGALGYAPPSMRSDISAWAKQRYDILKMARGADTGPNNLLTKTTTYTDIAVVERNKLYEMQEFAEAHGYDFESLMIHTSRDMQWAETYPPFKPVDCNQFDYFDLGEDGFMRNGVLTQTSGIFSDVTRYGSITVPDTLYVGYMVPYDQINFTISTPRTGGDIAFKYWNGSTWEVLTDHFDDGTQGLTGSGKVYFYPPADWTKRSLNSSQSKFWVQIAITGATAPPVYSSIKGDDWTIAGGTNNSRGWDSSDPNRINIGTPLEYNPDPPAHATAKFRYQSRVPMNFWNGYVYLNQSYNVNNTRPAGKYLAYDVALHMKAPYSFSGAFLDDAQRLPNVTPGSALIAPEDPMQYFDVSQFPSPAVALTAEQAEMYTQLVNDLHETYGADFWVGSNSQLPVPPAPPYGDFALIEGFITPDSHNMTCHYGVWQAGGIGRWCPYDWGLPANNANNVKFYFQAWDRWAFQNAWAPITMDSGPNNIFQNWHYVDQGNRTPIALLAMHLIGKNENTGFAYFGGPIGWNAYYQTDEVYTIKPATTLTEDVPANTNFDQAKTFVLASKTNCKGAGRYLKLGGPGGGELVQGQYGRLIWAGLDKTWDWSTETNLYGYLLSGWPNTIIATYQSKYSSLDMSFVTPATAAGNTVWEYWNGSNWVSLTVTDGTNEFRKDGTVTWTPPSDWATKNEEYWTPSSALGNYTGYAIRITTYSQPKVAEISSSEWLVMDSVAGPNPTATGHSTSLVYNSYPAGTAASCVKMDHLSQIPSPAASDVYQWVRWFPAMATDVGVPDANGLNGGNRIIPWKTGGSPDNFSGLASCTGSSDVCSDIWRRDLTKGIVLFRPYTRGFAGGGIQHIESEIDTYSKTIALGRTYYPLRADGTVGEGITSIALRGGEGAVLMLEPQPALRSTSGAFSGGWSIK